MRGMKLPHRVLAAWVAATLGLAGTAVPCAAAEIRSSTDPVAAVSTDPSAPSSHYKKKIPGTTTKIRGSKPRSYLKPKKQTYKEHMSAQKVHRFKNESSSFGHRAASAESPVSRRSVRSEHTPSSRVHVHQHSGRPAAGLSRNQPLSQSDHVFLSKLTDTVRASDPGTASRLAQIADGQKKGRTLTKDEYDFLSHMSDKIDDGQASCEFRSKAPPHSDPIRHPVPIQSATLFRSKAPLFEAPSESPGAFDRNRLTGHSQPSLKSLV
jgi:hypothetical protein